MTEAYRNVKYRLDDFQDNEQVDTAGYFGTNHRLVEKYT